MCVDVCWVVVTVEQLLIVLIRLWTKSELVRSDVRYSSVDPFSRPPSVVSSLYRPIKMALVDSSETYDAEQLARSMRETHLPDWMRISLPAIPSSLLVCGPSSVPPSTTSSTGYAYSSQQLVLLPIPLAGRTNVRRSAKSRFCSLGELTIVLCDDPSPVLVFLIPRKLQLWTCCVSRHCLDVGSGHIAWERGSEADKP
jgi:hypothetical protein